MNKVRNRNSFFFNEIFFQNEEERQKQIVSCIICEKITSNFLIDSGSDVNTVSEEVFEQLSELQDDKKIQLTNMKNNEEKKRITAYGSEKPLKIVATFWATIRITGSKELHEIKFFVIRGSQRSLLGRKSALDMKVLKLGLCINSCELKSLPDFDDVFPSVPGELVHFEIDPSVPPTRNAYYSVPAAYRGAARELLKQMEAKNIIETVSEAPSWISGMVAVPKGKDNFRLVVNMRGPNKAIKRAYHQLPTLDEMRIQLAGAKWFSKLDLKNAFHHLLLDESSRKMTTFQTELGMRRFTRLVFGVNCAPEIFQRMMERKLEGIEGVIAYIDDILIFAKDPNELNERTSQVMTALKKNNLTINHEKCEYKQQSITFLGHNLSGDGFAIDEKKAQDVMTYRSPNSTAELKSFLGLASYLSDHLPRFADMVKPMRDVAVRKDFEWTSEAEKSFEKTKKAIIQTTQRLGFFENGDKTFLYTDASPYAVGAVLTQEDKNGVKRTISFASRVLTKTENAYPHFQKEALAIIWAVERFHYYLLGREFTIRTDAKGISFIYDRENRSNKRVMNRAEGWALRLSAYNCKIEWIAGKENISDPSSRLADGSSATGSKVQIPGNIGALEINWNESITDSGTLSIKEIQEETATDGVLLAVKEALETEIWPETIKKWFAIKEQLSWRKEMLTKTGAIIVPRSLQKKALKIAHAGHPGESTMKSIMRENIWWHGMSTDIANWVRQCQGCVMVARPEKPVPMRRTLLPVAPWEALAIDYNGKHSECGDRMIVVLVDYFTRLVVANFIKSTDISSLTKFLDETFATYGFPGSIRSDNGPPFNGAEWINYCTSRGITVEKSTPAFPQQNGMVERYMQLINKAVTIAVATGQSADKGLYETVKAHNAARHRITGEIPEELMFGRKVRRNLPLLEGKRINTGDLNLRERDWNEKERAGLRENKKRGARETCVQVGDEVLVKRTQKAKDQTIFGPTKYKVTSREQGDVTMQGPSGEQVKRNVTQLKRLVNNGMEIEENITMHVEPQDEPRAQRSRRPPCKLADYAWPVEEKNL